ncbi:MAG: ABC transporter substrate-binding protein, partial [Planctomycetota bacterium]
VLPLVVLLAVGALVGAVIRNGQLPPADFAFVNGAEVKSFDPAVLTDNASGRIAWALYEGLVRLSPDDRSPLPGVAERWDVSGDGLTYTFHLRPGVKWSNSEPVTAADFVYSMRRFLDLRTRSEYAYQAWYLQNARQYSQAARGVAVGEPVEVELHEPPAGALPHARGDLLRGKLIRIEADADATHEQLADDDSYVDHRAFVVALDDGAEQVFRVSYDGPPAGSEPGVRSCVQIALDFREVGVRAVDPRTVEMVLESPTPYWLELVGFYPLSPVNRKCIETHGARDWTRPENLVTNGPYTLEFRRLRDRIRLKKNPLYWNADSVALETIDALSTESMNTAFNL